MPNTQKKASPTARALPCGLGGRTNPSRQWSLRTLLRKREEVEDPVLDARLGVRRTPGLHFQLPSALIDG